ncbi:MAG: beta-ketoacyl-[acyl-carrier-protein] synthase family protein [Verrucomicrobia subdivision 3 bacterium]|nr:beta-ketoacyl-[acyl-carrier-protein] synthase family protein [Limisphaerales bacterium]
MLFPVPGPLSPPRVVVTGAGVITALGATWSANAEGFRTGRTAFRPVTLFDVSRQRVKMAAEVDLPSVLPKTLLTRRDEQRLDRATRLLLHAAAEAWKEAGWEASDQGFTPSAIPIVLGTTSGGMTMGQDYFRQAISAPARRWRQATRVTQYQAQNQAMMIARAFGFEGPITIIANACASGANAIGHTWSLLRHGHATRVLTGGYDALCQLVFSGFDSLQALTPTTCRPFDRKRDGLALGEGAAVFALETLDSAVARGAAILGEIAGYGAVNDAYHLTQPHPEGAAAFESMTLACHSAGVTPEQIGYVNAHGTATPLNDSAEAAAINRWAGTHGATLSVSSTKSSIGHLLGAAGAVEAGVCLMALREGWLPPTMATESIDPQCAFRLVTRPESARVDYALSNSFGFGGANASLVIGRGKMDERRAVVS